ncbi:MAG: class I SAM-dependent methyltransferase [Gammaproteobacteria bacterium]|nr:class I SAM-dependent methyltransferase [Gammaproteobacteria bacterium]
MCKKIDACRICGNTHLERVLDLGEQVLTGVFPGDKNADITKGPLRLVKCTGEGDICGLLQMEHSYDLGEMYGDNYGYRSGLNDSMVKHLHEKIARILGQVELHEGDLVVDIGSNDSTTLQAYPSSGPVLVGIDPTGVKFHKYYPEHIQLIPEFFTYALVNEQFPDKKAKVITSFSMFYDLEAPMIFMQDIYDVLADDGIWVFEQSYMPTMLEMNSYDTVCHEHLEYYSLSQIKWMADHIGFSIIDVEFNAINGGSFSVTVKKAVEGKGSNHSHVVDDILKNERELKLYSLEPYLEFSQRVEKLKSDLIDFVAKINKENKKICVLGASTKGNVLLQYCDFADSDIPFVGEVNPEKYGRYTPGSNIPIISEDELIAKSPDYLLVLPWHFKEFFLASGKFGKSKLVFPLPELSVDD